MCSLGSVQVAMGFYSYALWGIWFWPGNSEAAAAMRGMPVSCIIYPPYVLNVEQSGACIAQMTWLRCGHEKCRCLVLMTFFPRDRPWLVEGQLLRRSQLPGTLQNSGARHRMSGLSAAWQGVGAEKNLVCGEV